MRERLNVSYTKIALNSMHVLEILIDLKTCQTFSKFIMALFYFIFLIVFALGFFFVVIVDFLAEIQKGKFMLTLVNRKNS